MQPTLLTEGYFLAGLTLYNQTIRCHFFINYPGLKHHNKSCFTREEVVKTLVRFHVPRREEWRPSQAGPCVNFDRKINCLTLALIFGQPNFPKFQHITPISFFCFYPTLLSCRPFYLKSSGSNCHSLGTFYLFFVWTIFFWNYTSWFYEYYYDLQQLHRDFGPIVLTHG